MQLTEFDRATSIEALGDGRYLGEIHSGWDIGGNANGGYVLAVAAAAMRAEAGRADPITITAHYLRPVPAGPLEIVTEVAKRGRQLTTVVATARRNGSDLLRVIGAFGELDAPDHSHDVVTGAPPQLTDYDASVDRQATSNGPGFPVNLMGRLAVRLHPDDGGFQHGQTTGRAVMRGWFAFADDRPVDTLALLLAADSFPPAVFNLEIEPGWVPTVDYNVQVRARPAPGPIACRFETRFLTDGRLEEDGELWDSTGQLVALSRQLALAPR